jgi:NTP pyrophosphatase (non-canonical NTP hydrolase)
MEPEELVYLACPYSHDDPSVRMCRFVTASLTAADLMRKGELVFSPISHGHPIAMMGSLPLGFDYWGRHNRAVLSRCSKLYVLEIDGWDKSVGVAAEIDLACRMGIFTEFIRPPVDHSPPSADAPFDFRRLQNEVQEWVTRNFGDSPAHRPLLGVAEEVGELALEHMQHLETIFLGLVRSTGELAHSQLKQEQGVRGTAAEHEELARDAVADIVVFLAAYCTARGFDFQEIVETTWTKVRQRDWKRNPKTGVAPFIDAMGGA